MMMKMMMMMMMMMMKMQMKMRMPMLRLGVSYAMTKPHASTCIQLRRQSVWTLEGHAPRIDARAFVADGSAIIGRVAIGARSSIWYNCTLRGDVNKIEIGEETNIQDGTVIHVARNNAQNVELPTIIGNQVTVGHMALLHACTLQDLSFIGMGAIVMDGCVVERGAMVAAGAMVTPKKVIKSGELWAGRPAKFMRELTSAERDFLPVSARKYAELAQTHRLHLRPVKREGQ